MSNARLRQTGVVAVGFSIRTRHGVVDGRVGGVGSVVGPVVSGAGSGGGGQDSRQRKNVRVRPQDEANRR